MFKVEEDIFIFLSAYPRDKVKAGIKKWTDVYIKKRIDHFNFLREAGFTECKNPNTETYMTDDGRPIGRAFGRYWILPKELQEERDYAAIEEEKKKPKPPASKTTEPVSSVGEGLSAVLCPKCTGIMAKQYICPNCEKGKEGYKVLCICVDCGYEVFL